MSDRDGFLGRDRRLVPLLNPVIGVLLILLGFVMGESVGSSVGTLLMALGGGTLIVAGVLGIWRPSRWGVRVENRWIAVAYGLGIVSLVTSLVVWML